MTPQRKNTLQPAATKQPAMNGFLIQTMFLLAVIFLPFCLSGCKKGDATVSEVDADYEFANLVEGKASDIPTLEELDAKVEWVDQPVLDSLDLLRDHLKKQKQLATVKEALKLRNRTPEDNAKIVSALGRLPKSDDEVDWDAEISRHTRGDVKTTNPILVSSTTEFEVVDMTGGALFGFDWDFNVFGNSETIEKWQVSKDRMYDKVILRDDWTWSDGKPVTAYDIEFSYNIIMTESVPVPAQRSGTSEVKFVKAYDAKTVVFFHKKALETNKWNVFFSIIPKHIYEKTVAKDPTLQNSPEHVAIEETPVTCGSYEVEKRVAGSEIVLKRRKSWYTHKGKEVRAKPYFKRVRFKIIEDASSALMAFNKGDIEEMRLEPAQWENQTDNDRFYKKNTKAYGVEWVCFSFFWNNQIEFFKDKRVRQAMSYAFDHEEMIEELRYGLDEPSTGIFHPASRWATKPSLKPYKQDFDKAEQLLAAAGWEDHDGDGYLDKKINGRQQRFEFTMFVSNQQWRLHICTLLQENLDRIGIYCRVQPIEGVVLQEKMRTKKFQAAFSGWGTGADPDTSKNLWKIGEKRNYVGYESKRVDELFKLGKVEFDIEKRAKIYQEIHRILWEDQPYTWLFYRNSMCGFSKELRGYKFSPRGPYNYGPGFYSIWKPKKK